VGLNGAAKVRWKYANSGRPIFAPFRKLRDTCIYGAISFFRICEIWCGPDFWVIDSPKGVKLYMQDINSICPTRGQSRGKSKMEQSNKFTKRCWWRESVGKRGKAARASGKWAAA